MTNKEEHGNCVVYECMYTSTWAHTSGGRVCGLDHDRGSG